MQETIIWDKNQKPWKTITVNDYPTIISYGKTPSFSHTYCIYSPPYNTVAYYKNGKLHKIDGPAKILSNRKTEFYTEGIYLSDGKLNDIEYMLHLINFDQALKTFSKQP